MIQIDELKQAWRDKVRADEIKTDEEKRKKDMIEEIEWDTIIKAAEQIFPALKGFIGRANVSITPDTIFAAVYVKIPEHLPIMISLERSSGTWKFDHSRRRAFAVISNVGTQHAYDLGEALCLAEKSKGKK